MTQMATSNSSRQQGQLPPKGIQPNETVNAICLRSGAEYEGPMMPIEEGDEEEVEDSEIGETTSKADRLLCKTDRPNHDLSCRKPKTDRLSPKADRPTDVLRQIFDKNAENSEILNSEARAKAKEPERPIEIILPFPNRQRNVKLESQFEKFMKVVKNLEVTVPFTELITQIPSYTRFMKDILSRKRALPDTETVALAHESSTLLQGTSPPKLSDPGSFSLTCTIGNVVIDKALCDLGASVSIMPFSVCQRLNMGELKYYGGRVQLADRSLRYPRGMLEDVPVKIGKFFIPVDFLVLDIAEDSHIPIILGRPFLRTAGAVIDVKNGRLTLEVCDEKITFNLSQALKQPMLEESSCFVDVLDDVVEEVWRESLMRDPLEDSMFLDSYADDFDTNSAVVDELEAALYCRELTGEHDEEIYELVNPSVAVGASLGTTKTPSKKQERPQPVAKKWVEVRRKPPGKKGKIRGPPLVDVPTQPTIEEQVEDLRKELAAAMQVIVTTASRLAVIETRVKPPDIEEHGLVRFGGGTPLPSID